MYYRLSIVPYFKTVVQVNYIMLLRSLKEYLQEHVSTQASEAISACWELEHALQDLTGTFIHILTNKTLPHILN